MRYNFRLVSSFEPRRCGVGIYGKSLLRSMKDFTSEIGPRDVAAIDNQNLIYGPDVDVVINQYNCQSWIDAAKNIGKRAEEKSNGGEDPTLVYINDEFGLGGKSWETDDNYVPFLKELKKTPAYKKGLLHIITCLHTIFAEPSEFHKKITKEKIENSDGTIVLAECGKRILTSNKYDIDSKENLIRHLDHGVRMSEYNDNDRKEIKKEWGQYGDSFTIVTPGLLGDGKGIFKYGVPGYVQLVKKLEKENPKIKTRYAIRGQCHPEWGGTKNYLENASRILKESGLLLNKNPFNNKRTIQETGRKTRNQNHGIIIDYNFLSELEYSKSFGGADLLLFPYLNKQQISSGQIAESIGQGRDTIASKFWHALEMLSNMSEIDDIEDLLNPNKMPKEGAIMGIGDPDAKGLLIDCDRGKNTINQIEKALNYSIIDEDAHILRAENAHEKGHEMVWKNIGWKTLHFGDFIRKRKLRYAS